MAMAKDTSVLLGKHDDNREGTILTKIAQGDLVRVPFPATLATSTTGSATAVHGQTNSNPDGSQHGYTLTAPAGLSSGAAVRLTAYGRIVGIRALRASAATPPFTVKVDGIIHGVRNTQARRNAQPAAITDNEALFIVADDLLTDGPHTVEISLASEASASRSLTLYGMLLEASKGYSAFPQVGMFSSAATALTTSAATITSTGFAVRKLCFTNSSGADRTVTLKNGSNTFRTLTVPTAAPSYAEHDFGQAIDINGWTAAADATGVSMWIQQGGRTR